MTRLLSELTMPSARARVWQAYACATPCQQDAIFAHQARLVALADAPLLQQARITKLVPLIFLTSSIFYCTLLAEAFICPHSTCLCLSPFLLQVEHRIEAAEWLLSRYPSCCSSSSNQGRDRGTSSKGKDIVQYESTPYALLHAAAAALQDSWPEVQVGVAEVVAETQPSILELSLRAHALLTHVAQDCVARSKHLMAAVQCAMRMLTCALCASSGLQVTATNHSSEKDCNHKCSNHCNCGALPTTTLGWAAWHLSAAQLAAARQWLGAGTKLRQPRALLAALALTQRKLHAANRDVEVLPVVQLEIVLSQASLPTELAEPAVAAAALRLAGTCDSLGLCEAAAGWLAVAKQHHCPSEQACAAASARLEAERFAAQVTAAAGLAEAGSDMPLPQHAAWLLTALKAAPPMALHVAATEAAAGHLGGRNGGSGAIRDHTITNGMSSSSPGQQSEYSGINAVPPWRTSIGRLPQLQHIWLDMAQQLVHHAQHAATRRLCHAALHVARRESNSACVIESASWMLCHGSTAALS